LGGPRTAATDKDILAVACDRIAAAPGRRGVACGANARSDSREQAIFCLKLPRPAQYRREKATRLPRPAKKNRANINFFGYKKNRRSAERKFEVGFSKETRFRDRYAG
jgi:hypothetical protein